MTASALGPRMEAHIAVLAGVYRLSSRIDPNRTQQAAKALLGENFGSFVITDRYAGYHWLDVLQQQLCWAHVIGQLIELSEREGAPGKLGARLLDAARKVIGRHRVYLQDGHDLSWLEAELAPLREQTRVLPEQGARGRHPKTRNFCLNLLDEFAALWTFCEVAGIDPTNNAAERALRHGVILRKTQQGTQSDRGSRWIQRICSIREQPAAQHAAAGDLP